MPSIAAAFVEGVFAAASFGPTCISTFDNLGANRVVAPGVSVDTKAPLDYIILSL
jgi:hypothetical protein